MPARPWRRSVLGLACGCAGAPAAGRSSPGPWPSGRRGRRSRRPPTTAASRAGGSARRRARTSPVRLRGVAVVRASPPTENAIPDPRRRGGRASASRSRSRRPCPGRDRRRRGARYRRRRSARRFGRSRAAAASETRVRSTRWPGPDARACTPSGYCKSPQLVRRLPGCGAPALPCLVSPARECGRAASLRRRSSRRPEQALVRAMVLGDRTGLDEARQKRSASPAPTTCSPSPERRWPSWPRCSWLCADARRRAPPPRPWSSLALARLRAARGRRRARRSGRRHGDRRRCRVGPSTSTPTWRTCWASPRSCSSPSGRRASATSAFSSRSARRWAIVAPDPAGLAAPRRGFPCGCECALAGSVAAQAALLPLLAHPVPSAHAGRAAAQPRRRAPLRRRAAPGAVSGGLPLGAIARAWARPRATWPGWPPTRCSARATRGGRGRGLDARLPDPPLLALVPGPSACGRSVAAGGAGWPSAL